MEVVETTSKPLITKDNNIGNFNSHANDSSAKHLPEVEMSKITEKKKLNQQITLVKKKTTQVLGGFASEL